MKPVCSFKKNLIWSNILDPWNCANLGSDIYSNVPLNIDWIKHQIGKPSIRSNTPGFTRKQSTLLIWILIFFYAIVK